jgi:tRNA(Ile)-lysidine synthase
VGYPVPPFYWAEKRFAVSPFVEAMWRSLEVLVAPASARSTGVVAVSGGPDSVALLRSLHAMAPKELVVAHFNHRLRGAEGEEDVRFVRDLAESLGLRFHAGSADVGEVAQATGANVEDAARQLRYRWLSETAGDVGATWVATGHTADDLAETVLHRLIRGAGLQGLRGISPRRDLSPGVVVVRPILGLSRPEVLAYLEGLGQPFRTDSTNIDTRLTRNRIRHELLPLLKTFNPEVVAALSRLAKHAEEADTEVKFAAARVLRKAERPRAGPLVILDAAALWPPNELIAAPGADPDNFVSSYLACEVFRRVWEREGWPLGAMTAAHWEQAVCLCSGLETAVEFPGGVVGRRVGPVVQLGRRT